MCRVEVRGISYSEFVYYTVSVSYTHLDVYKRQEYVESETFLNDRFSQAVTIKGTQQYHAYIPVHSLSLIHI